MTVEEDCLENCARLRLCIAAEADATAVPRLLGHFQTLNVIPRRIVAELATNGIIHVQIEVSGITEKRMSMIAAKVGQGVAVLNSYWCRI